MTRRSERLVRIIVSLILPLSFEYHFYPCCFSDNFNSAKKISVPFCFCFRTSYYIAALKIYECSNYSSKSHQNHLKWSKILSTCTACTEVNAIILVSKNSVLGVITRLFAKNSANYLQKSSEIFCRKIQFHKSSSVCENAFFTLFFYCFDFF